MRHEKINGATHIYVEEGETEQQVLRAIVKASFELARPAGMGWLHFNDSQQMTDEIADQCIMLEPNCAGDKTIINMDYVQGRQCKTRISRVEEGHFMLANYSYERVRGVPDPMLDKAKEIIAGKQGTGLASTSHMYKGESLTLRLKEYGFTRQNGESDWNFRKRVFPDLFNKVGGDRAMEFLQGSSAAEWDEMDKMLYLILVSENKDKPDRNALVKFAKGFAADPLEMRERWKVAVSA
jgi:hypothetical protein